MTPEEEAVARCFALLPLLRERPGIPLDELSRLLRCSRPCLAEDLMGLLLCGLPPYLPHDFVQVEIEDGRARVRFADHFARPVSLDPIEVLALRVACRASAPRGTERARFVEPLLAKIEQGMAEEPRRLLHRLARRAWLGETFATARPAWLTTLARAIETRHRVRLAYRARGHARRSDREVDPYAMVERGGTSYLVGRDHARRKVVSFREDRILSVEPLAATFKTPDGFPWSRPLHAAWFEEDRAAPRARIRIPFESGHHLQEIVDPTEIQRRGEDLIWRPWIVSEDSLLRFLLGRLGSFEIEAPASLRARAFDWASRVASAHRGSRAGASKVASS
jgi:predicted DNA-binding transcriptional regulator YafY